MPRDSMVRLKAFQVNEKERQRDQLANMIADFGRMAGDLDAQIGAEEARSGIDDPTHFAYPMTAKAARTRRDKLNDSMRELRVQLDAAAIALEEAQGRARQGGGAGPARRPRAHPRGGRAGAERDDRLVAPHR